MKAHSLCFRTTLVTVLSLLLVFVIPFTASRNQSSYASGASPPVANAVWFWQANLINSSSNEIIQFLSEQQVNIVYIQISRNVSTNSYRNFIQLASSHQIEVHALDGAPNWALSSNLPKLESFMNWIENYQQTAAPNQRFSGIHVDIEPQLIKEWTTDRNLLITQWQSNVTYLVQRANSMNLPLSAALAFWLDSYYVPGTNTSVSTWMIEQLDSVTIMTYRDSANVIYDFGSSELLDGDLLHKKVYLSVETKHSSEGNRLTFYEEGSSYMNEQLLQVRAMASSHPSFAGITIHDLVGWMSLVNNSDN